LPAGAKADLTTVDASFISLRLLLPVIRGWLSAEGRILALIKPQFEAERSQVGRGGVVRDATVHQAVLNGLLSFASEMGLAPQGVIPSPLRGPAGNVEFLAYLRLQAPALSDIEETVQRCLQTVPG
jgi:23S rRNA (cytidine1920-2'-O)/16S rRNA (cytidine1409-2'-O)-methyltransferase